MNVWRALNGLGKATACGVVMIGLAALFVVINAAPWAGKETTEVRVGGVEARVADLKQQIDAVKEEQGRRSGIVYGISAGLQAIQVELTAMNRRLDRIEQAMDRRR